MANNGTLTTAVSAAAAAAAAGGVAYLIYCYNSAWVLDVALARSSKKALRRLLRADEISPLLGDALAISANMDRIHDFWLEHVEEAIASGDYGPYTIRLPFQAPMTMIIREDIVEHVQKDHFTDYVKGQNAFSRLKDVLGHGIFNVDGPEWKHQRKTAANIFTLKNFKEYMKEYVNGVFVTEMAVLEKRFREVASSDTQTIDLQDLLFRFTLDSFGKIAFGADINSLGSKDPVQFAIAFDNAQTIAFRRFFTPLWQLVQKLNGTASQQIKNVEVIQKFCYEIIDQRLNDLENGAADDSSKDLLSFLMSSTDPLTGKPPTRRALLDHVINFIIAGRDTTAEALSWSFFLLDQHPHVAKNLQQEVEETFSGLGPNDRVSHDQIKNMAYANAVFHESLRLYPSVSTRSKFALKDDILPDGTFVPAGTQVMWNLYVMARLKSVWGEDAKEFRPERWLEMDKQPSQYKYNVFNGGPRICLGKNFAELEGVFVLVETLRKFKIEVVDTSSVTYTPALTLLMKNGLKARVSLRE